MSECTSTKQTKKLVILHFRKVAKGIENKISHYFVFKKWFVYLNSIHNGILSGTVSVILSDPPCKDGNTRFTTAQLGRSILLVSLHVHFRFLCESDFRIPCLYFGETLRKKFREILSDIF